MPLLEDEIAVLHDQVEKARARTHRAIAVEQVDSTGRIEAETHGTAMATAGDIQGGRIGHARKMTGIAASCNQTNFVCGDCCAVPACPYNLGGQVS